MGWHDTIMANESANWSLVATWLAASVRKGYVTSDRKARSHGGSGYEKTYVWFGGCRTLHGSVRGGIRRCRLLNDTYHETLINKGDLALPIDFY